MNQTLLSESYNNEQNVAVLQTEKQNAVNNKKNFGVNFDSIINERNIERNQVNKTSVDKNMTQKKYNNQTTTNLMEVINSTAEEIGVENALNLTLEESVEDIISEFKDIATTELEEIDEIVEDTVEIISAPLDSLVDNTENVEKVQNTTAIANIINTCEKITNTNVDTTNIEFADKTVDIENTVNKILHKNNTENADDKNSSIEELLGEDKIKDLKIESIKAEVDDNNNNGSMPSESAEEHSIKAILNTDADKFELNIEKTDSIKQAVQAKTTEISNGKIIEQITKHIDRLNSQSKISMVLNPENLGKVSIQLTKTPEGMSAQFTVSTQEARELLMRNVDGLREALLSHGVNVDNLNIKLSDTQKSSYNQDWTEQDNSQGGNKNNERQNNKNKNSNMFEQMIANNIVQEEIEEKI